MKVSGVDYKIPAHPSKDVFRTYDIRGPVEENAITEDLAYAIGRAIASEARDLGRSEIIVGRDGRLSGPAMKAALVQGVLDSGCDVIDIGILPTPLLYFATSRLPQDCGVMITASHNPGNHNGFKTVLCGKTLSTEGVQKLYQRICEKDFTEGTGKITELDVIEDYIDYVSKRIVLKRKLKVVIDCGNGVAGEIAPRLFKQLGCEVIELFCDIDGHFPNHHPDPTVPENLNDIIEAVKRNKADIGLAFDGDADRLGVVTDRGDIIWPDRLMMIFSKDVLSRYPHRQIVFDVKCSSLLPEIIKASGGEPVMYRTGHSVIKAKMLELNSPLSGEMSGHVFFNDEWFGFDDGMYVGARLLRIIADDDVNASAIFDALPSSVFTPELKLPMTENKKPEFMRRLLEEADFGDAKRITIDGLRVEFPASWGLVRPSNTSPYLIIRFEANDEAQLEAIKSIFRQVLLQIEPSLQLPF